MFPYKDYDKINNKNIFGNLELSSTILELLEKNILNYPNYEIVSTLSDDDKELLKEYILFLFNTYFSTIGNSTFDPEIDDKLFDYNKWNAIVETSLQQETFLKQDFINKYNKFLKEQANQLFTIITNDYNDYINRINKIYGSNAFEDKNLIFDLIGIEKIDLSLQKKYNNYIHNKTVNNVDNIAIVKKLPQNFIPLTHFMVEE